MIAIKLGKDLPVPRTFQAIIASPTTSGPRQPSARKLRQMPEMHDYRRSEPVLGMPRWIHQQYNYNFKGKQWLADQIKTGKHKRVKNFE